MKKLAIATRILTWTATWTLTAVVAATGVGSSAGASAADHPSRIRSALSRAAVGDGVSEIAISFRVRNVNRSDVPCASDGRSYTVRGHLIAPTPLLRHDRIDLATLYLHGLSFGEFFYRFRGASDADYAVAQARNGHASVVIDRLGYGRSGVPDGNQVCVGSRADMAHQMVRKLRSGRYHLDRTGKPRFDRVVLAGHSLGGQIAQVEAYSFGDIAGLVVLGYSDRVQSEVLKSSAAYAAQVCAGGGQTFRGRPGYAPFGPPSGAPAALFNSAKPGLEKSVLARLSIDPCGDTASFTAATAADLRHLGDIDVPVLVVGGGADALFPRPAAANQAGLLTGSRSVTQTTLAGTAHAFTFERGRDRLVRVVDRWLERRERHPAA